MDNLNSPRLVSLKRRFGRKKGEALWARFEVHYTPKHESWLNQAEMQIGYPERECLAGCRLETLERLIAETTAWVTNAKARTRKDAKE